MIQRCVVTLNNAVEKIPNFDDHGRREHHVNLIVNRSGRSGPDSYGCRLTTEGRGHFPSLNPVQISQTENAA
jgi:hypothetical protein